MIQKRFGALSSSVNPEELSATVTGILKVVAGVAVTGGILSVADSTTLLHAVPQIITQVATMVPIVYSVWNSAEVIFGIARKVIVGLFEHKTA